MHCPFCQTAVTPDTAQCPACLLTFPRTCTLVGPLPKLAPGVADPAGLLESRETAQLQKARGKLEREFPQLVVQLVLHAFPAEHPFAMHAFWMFNAGNFAGDSCRGKKNHALLVAADPQRREGAIAIGYGLEPFLTQDLLGPVLAAAAPAWQSARWTDGFLSVLAGLTPLLREVSQPAVAQPPTAADF